MTGRGPPAGRRSAPIALGRDNPSGDAGRCPAAWSREHGRGQRAVLDDREARPGVTVSAECPAARDDVLRDPRRGWDRSALSVIRRADICDLLVPLIAIDSVNPTLVRGGGGEGEVAEFVAG